jgi:hypothetical protein
MPGSAGLPFSSASRKRNAAHRVIQRKAECADKPLMPRRSLTLLSLLVFPLVSLLLAYVALPSWSKLPFVLFGLPAALSYAAALTMGRSSGRGLAWAGASAVAAGVLGVAIFLAFLLLWRLGWVHFAD